MVTRLATKRGMLRSQVEQSPDLWAEMAQLLYEDAIEIGRELVNWPEKMKPGAKSRITRLGELEESDAIEDRLAAELYRNYVAYQQKKKAQP